MSFADRLGIIGIVVALLSVAAASLAPEQKIVGWIALVCGVGSLLLWAGLEGWELALGGFAAHPTRTTVLVGVGGGLLIAGLFFVLASLSGQRPLVPAHPLSTSEILVPNMTGHNVTSADSTGSTETRSDRVVTPLPHPDDWVMFPRVSLGGTLADGEFTEFGDFQRFMGWQVPKRVTEAGLDWASFDPDSRVEAEIQVRIDRGRVKCGIRDVDLGTVVGESDWIVTAGAAEIATTHIKIGRAVGHRRYQLILRAEANKGVLFVETWARGEIGPLAPAYSLGGAMDSWATYNDKMRWEPIPGFLEVTLDWEALQNLTPVAQVSTVVQRLASEAPNSDAGFGAVRLRDVSTGDVLGSEERLGAFTTWRAVGPGEPYRRALAFPFVRGIGKHRYRLETRVTDRSLRIAASGKVVITR